jgi:hypothetical protein
MTDGYTVEIDQPDNKWRAESVRLVHEYVDAISALEVARLMVGYKVEVDTRYWMAGNPVRVTGEKGSVHIAGEDITPDVVRTFLWLTKNISYLEWHDGSDCTDACKHSAK